jgi:hypothetical protein
MRTVPDRDSETTEMFRRIHANRHLFSLEANLEALRLARERKRMTNIQVVLLIIGVALVLVVAADALL